MSTNSDLKFDRGGGRGEPVPLPRKGTTLYGGIFASWFLRKEGQYGPSMLFKLLVTHREVENEAGNMVWKPLEKITQAGFFIGSSEKKNEKTGEKTYDFAWKIYGKNAPSPNTPSQLLAFVAHALGVDPKSLINVDSIPAVINRAVGKAVLFQASVTSKDGKHYNTVDKQNIFAIGDDSFKKIAERMEAKVQTKQDNEENSYVSYPEANFVRAEEPERKTEVEYEKSGGERGGFDRGEQHVEEPVDDMRAVDTTTGEVLTGSEAREALLDEEVPF